MIVKRLFTLSGVFLILLFALLCTRDGNIASAASNIYVRVTVVPNDIDIDGYSNDEEIAAGSNPADPDSTPGTTQLNLYTGVNFISLRADVLSMGNTVALLESLGGSQVIRRVLIFDPGSQSFIEAIMRQESSMERIMRLQQGRQFRLYLFQRGLLLFFRPSTLRHGI